MPPCWLSRGSICAHHLSALSCGCAKVCMTFVAAAIAFCWLVLPASGAAVTSPASTGAVGAVDGNPAGRVLVGLGLGRVPWSMHPVRVVTVAIARMSVAAVLRIGSCLYLVLVGEQVGRELVAGEPPDVVDLRGHDPGSRIWVADDRSQLARLNAQYGGDF